MDRCWRLAPLLEVVSCDNLSDSVHYHSKIHLVTLSQIIQGKRGYKARGDVNLLCA